MKKIFSCLILIICFFIPFSFIFTGCDVPPTLNYEGLLQSIYNTCLYVTNGRLVDLEVSEDWYIYNNVNFNMSFNLDEHLSGNNSILAQAKTWFATTYTSDMFNKLQTINETTYIKVNNSSSNHMITIYKDTGSFIEALRIIYLKSEESNSYRTMFNYARCGSTLTYYDILFDELSNLDKTEYSKKYVIDVNYSTLKANFNNNFDLSKFPLIDFEQIHHSYNNPLNNDPEILIYNNGYGYTYRTNQGIYKTFLFYVEYNQKEFIDEQYITDNSISSYIYSLIKSSFEDIVIDIYNI